MTTPGTVPVQPGVPTLGRARPTPLQRLWNRELDSYPHTNRRVVQLVIAVVATIVLYYELYVVGAVAPAILQHYGMSFTFYVYGVGVIAGAAGAVFSLLAGLADRFGRANMVAYGLLITALLVLFGVPNAPDKWSFMVLIGTVGAVEGIILVATPALIRDFTPQARRATALGFWTLGPVLGSLTVAEVSSNTLSHLRPWQDQFVICGIVGLVMFVIALVGLRELSPGLRNQLMVSQRDRVLVEARARGIDIAAALRKPWRQMVHLDIIGPGFGAAVLLLVYYALVGFLVIYFATVYGYPEQQANALANWYWAFNAGALVVVGLVSDRLRVRKPFMVLGAIGAIVMTIIFLSRATMPQTSYYTFVVIMSLLAVSLGIAYAPWFAAFTETVEKRNPALMATGLAVNGYVLRGVVTLSALILPFVVSSVTPLVNYAPKYTAEIQTAAAIAPSTLKTLQSNPANPVALKSAVSDISANLHVSSAVAIQRLTALGKAATQPNFKSLTSAKTVTASQWQHWWWVCVGGQVVFIPLVFLLVGRWNPSRAKRDAEEHDRMIEEEMKKLSMPAPSTTAV